MKMDSSQLEQTIALKQEEIQAQMLDQEDKIHEQLVKIRKDT